VLDQRQQDPKDAVRMSVTADGVERAAHALAQSEPAPGRVEKPPQRSPARTVLARRAATAFTSCPYRPGDGDTTVGPPGRMPRSTGAGALIAGLVLVAGAFVMSGLHHRTTNRSARRTRLPGSSATRTTQTPGRSRYR
jgi:hypothetical protein